ncbi:retrotransposon protein, putative, ty1-copia subclass [Tanacetum coccineum]
MIKKLNTGEVWEQNKVRAGFGIGGRKAYTSWAVADERLKMIKGIVVAFGCEALVKRDTLTKPDKLEPRSIKCIFEGYPKETMGYSFYYPPENKVFVAWNAEFFENSLITQEASGSLEDLEIIQEEYTHPSITLLGGMGSSRTRHAPYRMCLHIDAKEHELGDLGEPGNYKAALLDPESDKWLDAINVEIQSMKDNKVWDLVDLPPNGKTVGSKWFFKKKTGMDGVVHTYKARLAYIEKILKRYFMENSKRGTISMQEKLKLSKSQDMFLVYEGDMKRELRVSCYTDAGYLTDADNLKSQTRYVFILNRGAVDWKSTKQSIFATSSTEAEYIAAYDASK